jgi:hypothetical protein
MAPVTYNSRTLFQPHHLRACNLPVFLDAKSFHLRRECDHKFRTSSQPSENTYRSKFSPIQVPSDTVFGSFSVPLVGHFDGSSTARCLFIILPHISQRGGHGPQLCKGQLSLGSKADMLQQHVLDSWHLCVFIPSHLSRPGPEIQIVCIYIPAQSTSSNNVLFQNGHLWNAHIYTF